MVQNPVEMIQAFNQFRNTFRGDPRQEVERLIQSGRISQAQLNQLQNMANQFMRYMNGNK